MDMFIFKVDLADMSVSIKKKFKLNDSTFYSLVPGIGVNNNVYFSLTSTDTRIVFQLPPTLATVKALSLPFAGQVNSIAYYGKEVDAILVSTTKEVAIFDETDFSLTSML